MKKRILILLVIGLIILISGCVREEPILPPKEGVYEELEGSVKLSISERFTEERDGGHISLNLATEKIYGCYNFQLNSNVKIQGNIIIVEIKNVFKPEMCLEALGPAKFSKNLGKIEGDYQLTMKYKDEEDKYNLKITKEDIKINLISSSFTILELDEVSRFPTGSIKVECLKNANDKIHESLCDQFYEELENLGATKSDKEYGKQLTGNNVLYDYTGGSVELENLIDTYAQYDYMLIAIYTWEGDSLYSWTRR